MGSWRLSANTCFQALAITLLVVVFQRIHHPALHHYSRASLFLSISSARLSCPFPAFGLRARTRASCTLRTANTNPTLSRSGRVLSFVCSTIRAVSVSKSSYSRYPYQHNISSYSRQPRTRCLFISRIIACAIVPISAFSTQPSYPYHSQNPYCSTFCSSLAPPNITALCNPSSSAHHVESESYPMSYSIHSAYFRSTLYIIASHSQPIIPYSYLQRSAVSVHACSVSHQ